MQEIEIISNEKIDKNIELWKKKLLDFTKRNNLIYFKYSKKSNLKINNKSLELFNLLINEDKRINIKNLDLVFEKTPEEEKELDKVLSKLRLRSNSVLKEKGINTLYLCLGMLRWRESDSSKIDVYSPLLLLPVQIIKTGKNNPFYLTSVDGDYVVNSTLMYKMKMDFGIEIYEDDEDISNVECLLNNVSKRIMNVPNWSVLDNAFLGIFTFSKISMYKDLERYEKDIHDHEIVSKLAGGQNVYSSYEFEKIEQLPLEKKTEEIFQVLDADSSQQKTLVTSKEGYSFVIEGPPGTGKSQTISNIIAEAIAQDKKVLFVSEKAAALEVVANRLNDVGLGDYILELHSNKANKKQVISEIYSQYIRNKRNTVPNYKLFFNEIENNVDSLDTYVQELSKKYQPLDKSAFDLHGELSKLSSTVNIPFKINNDNNLTIDQITNMKGVIKELEYKHSQLYKYKTSLWTSTLLNECNLQRQRELEVLIIDTLQSIEKLKETVLNINDTYNLNIDNLLKISTLNAIPNTLNTTAVYNYSYFSKESFGEICDYIEKGKLLQEEYNRTNDIVNLNYNNLEQIKSYKDKNKILQQLKLLLGDEAFESLIKQERLDTLELTTNEIFELTNQLIEDFSYLCNIFGQSFKSTINKVEYYDEILNILPNCKSAPLNWFNNLDYAIQLQKDIVPAIKNDIVELKSNIEDFEKSFKSDLYKEDKAYLIKLINLGKNKSAYERTLELYELNRFGREDANKFELCIENLAELTRDLFDKLNINPTMNYNNLVDILDLVKLMEETKHFEPSWFENNYILVLKNIKDKISKSINELTKKREEVNSIFKETIYNIDYVGCYNRFCKQYIGKLRFLNGNYKRDKINIERCLIDAPKNISYELLLEHLEKLVMLDKEKEKFEELESDYVISFGPLMNGIDTDIKQLEQTIQNVEIFISLWNKYGQSKEILEFATKQKARNEIIDIFSRAYHNKEVYSTLSECLAKQYNIDNTFLITSFTEQLQIVKNENVSIESIFNDFDRANSLCIISKLPFKEFIIKVEEALIINNGIDTLSRKETEFKEILGKDYKGIATDWYDVEYTLDNIIKIEKASKILTLEEKEQLIKYINFDLEDNKSKLIKTINNMKNSYNNINLRIDEFIELNNTEKSLYKKEALNNLELNILNNSIGEINSKLKVIKNVIQDLLLQRNSSFNSIADFNEDLININSLIACEENFKKLENVCIELFGEAYQKYDTDWYDIEENVNSVRNTINALTSAGIDISETLKVSLSNYEDREKLISTIPYDNILKVEKLIENILLLMKNNKLEIDGSNLVLLELNKCEETLSTLKEQIPEVELIIKIRNIINDAKDCGIDDFVYKALDTDIKDNFVDIFDKGLYTILLDNIYINSIQLRNFDKERFIRTLNEFKINDKKLIEINSKRIRGLLDIRSTERLKDMKIRRQLNLLSSENTKKKRHLPIRNLFSNMPDVIKILKPCVMMSPLSVSEFIDLYSFKFDVVIFDEASQICPEDAIGAMIRGDQIIIAGDKKQLPPTKFFNSGIEESDDYDSEEEAEIEDILSETDYESILDLSSTYMHSTRLLWHYRSKHESLITFSNKHFYDNTLYTFPSTENSDNIGVKFEFVEGIYDQGGSSTNVIEAKRVAELVVKHFKEQPDKSLGVITFGAKQMDCIIDMINEAKNNNPALEKYFDEEKKAHFFVKNLENVQGDERDTIILSVCYGYSDLARKKLSHNFGPINKAGGERRLNVAVTRAKYQLILVSSIKDSDIDLSRTTSVGASLLKDYIQFARTGKLPESIITENRKRFDSPLEEDIYNELIKLGYKVDTQVGCSGYRIDLAIKDPKHKGNYLMGVECDGASYHSSKSARDRDRLRQEVLEGLGWKIHRIWSQDWFKNKHSEIRGVKAKVEKLIEVN